MRPIAVCAMVVVERTHVSRSHRNHPAFPTQWFTVTPCSPRCSGRFGHRHQRNCFHQLDTSVGVPGPHGFSVRIRRRRLRHHPRPSHPAPRFVTLRNAPLSGRDLMTILQVQIAVKHYFRKTENNLRNAEPVIPGLEPAGRPAARWRESPESTTTTGGYGFRACAKRASRNDGCWDNLVQKAGPVGLAGTTTCFHQ